MKMNAFRNHKWLLVGAFLGVVLSFLSPATLFSKDGKEVISVEKDKDKTSYVIRGSNDNTEKDDRDRAWEMLDRVIIDTRGSHGEGADHHR